MGPETISALNAKGPRVAPHADGVWKTSQGSLLAEWETYSATWPRSGSMRNGACSEPGTLERPTAASASGSSRGEWPTPRASDANRDPGLASRYGPGQRRSNLKDALRYQQQQETGARTPGALNPTWVEWLMGFPLEWTVCEPSVTPSSRRARRSSDAGSSTSRRTR